MQRAKDLNGLLTILAEATHALDRVVPILNRLPDTESQIQTQDLRVVREELEMLGRDLAGGVVDLRELHFDESAWKLNFNDSPLQLASEPDHKPDSAIDLTDEYVEPLDRTPVRDSLFDFDAPPVQDLGAAPDLLQGIDTNEPTYDDAPTVPLDPETGEKIGVEA
jgi:hypothetical protein